MHGVELGDLRKLHRDEAWRWNEQGAFHTEGHYATGTEGTTHGRVRLQLREKWPIRSDNSYMGDIGRDPKRVC